MLRHASFPIINIRLKKFTAKLAVWKYFIQNIMRFIRSKLSRKYSQAAARARWAADIWCSPCARASSLSDSTPDWGIVNANTFAHIFPAWQIYASCSMGEWATGRGDEWAGVSWSGRRQEVSYYSRPVTASFPLRHFASARKSIWSEGFSSFRLRLTWFHVAFWAALPDRFRLQRVYAGPGLIAVVRIYVESRMCWLQWPCPVRPCPVTAAA